MTRAKCQMGREANTMMTPGPSVTAAVIRKGMHMAKNKPLVGVVMGSDSDAETMRRCAEQLAAFGIACEMRILSAHRTPQATHDYAASAQRRGLKVIIAGAGMSAALAGAMASATTLPVIGVPICSGALKAWTRPSAPSRCPPACRSRA